MTYSSDTPRADWYPDPSGGSFLRWWNGLSWAEETQPYVAEPGPMAAYPDAPAYPTPSYPGAASSAPAVALQPYNSYEPAPYYGVGSAPSAIGTWRSPADDRPVIHGLADAIVAVLRKYASFTGRAGRREFWLWQLLLFVTALVVLVPYLGILLWLMWGFAVFIPSLAVAARRLRDAGLSGWWLLMSVVPFGAIALAVMFCQPSKHP